MRQEGDDDLSSSFPPSFSLLRRRRRKEKEKEKGSILESFQEERKTYHTISYGTLMIIMFANWIS